MSRYSHAMKGYKTLSQMGAMLGVDTSALRHAIQRGTLQAEIEGKTYFVTDEEVHRYMEQNTSGNGRRGRPPKPRPVPPKGGTDV